MLREEHQLTPTSGNSRPSRIIFFDTETLPTQIFENQSLHTLRLGHAKFCRTRRGEQLKEQSSITFHNQEDFWKWGLAKTEVKEHIYLVSHNLNYDLPIMKAFSFLEAENWHVVSFYTKGMVSVVRWEKYFPSCQCHKTWILTAGRRGVKPPNTKLTAVDNTNYFSGALSKWGELINLPKLSVQFDGEEHKLIEYCVRDVQIIIELWLMWFAFLDANDCGNWKYTAGSTSLNAFRSNYMKHYIQIHNNVKAIDLERAAYKGGRVECFYRGEYTDQEFYLLDVNSMYPFVMANNQYPRELLAFHNKYPLKRLRANIENYAFIADCTININLPYFPHKIDNKTAYPRGYFRTTLTTPELKICLQHGWLIEIHALARYSQDHLFTDFVHHFYGVRKEYERNDKKLLADLCKLMLNSLYGKFGQLGYEDKLVGFGDIDDFENLPTLDGDTGEWLDRIHIAGTVIDRIATGEHWNSFPAIAAHVTAFARVHLFNLIIEAGRDNVYYCDTDSVIVNQQGYDILKVTLDDVKLGALKLELQSDFLTVNAPKDYSMRNRTKIKGVRKDAIEIRPNVFQQEQWPKLPGLLRAESLDTYVIKTITKHLAREVHAHKIMEHNGRVIPFRLLRPQ